ncbi:MAG: energy transducer TonB [Gemmatimonadales bacterium]|nr:MAG: energy transducer TonB [Gemmatimonadales bacterium]
MNRTSLRSLALPAAFFAVSPIVLGACGGDREIEQPAPLMAEVPIVYPLALWDQDIEGETLLRVRVTDTGQVDSVEVVASSGYTAFDSAAIAGARELRFEPARRDGKRIQVWARVPVHFSKRPRPGGVDAQLY